MKIRAMKIAMLAALVLAMGGCDQPLAPRFVRSCRGEYVDFCRPYTYAQITSASLSPERLEIGDPTTDAHVVVDFETCGASTPARPRIDVSALIAGAGSDGGADGTRVVPLVSIPASTDPTATHVDVMIDNPFFTDVPAETTITLQFTPVIDMCAGEVFRVMYRTGEVVEP